jgi:hypothetical protein
MGRSPGRSAQARGGDRDRGGAQRQGRTTRRNPGQAQPARGGRRPAPRFGWSRRLGLAAALVLLGVSVVLAGHALAPPDEPGRSATPVAASPGESPPSVPDVLPVAPELLAPETALTAEPGIELRGRLNEDLPRDGRYRLRIYVNGELALDRRLPRRQNFSVARVPLSEGANSITAAIAGPLGESLHSAPVAIELDSTPPGLGLQEPPSGAVVYGEAVVVRGNSEAGASLTLANRATGWQSPVEVGADGRFEATVALAVGVNDVRAEARDAAGNVTRANLSVERRDGSPSVTLTLSRDRLALAELPTTISLRARVLDPAGLPVDGADVTLSISPPGLPTFTHHAATSAGTVTWSAIRLSRDGAQRGEGLVTVMVVLPDGTTIQQSAFFTID